MGNTGKMGKTILILGLVSVVLATSGCTGGGTTTTEQLSEMTPSEVVAEYIKAHKHGDYEKMYSLMSTEYRNSHSEASFRTQIEAPRRAMEQQGTPIKFIKVTGEEISGNSATVEFMYELSSIGVTETETVELIKESDGWKIVNAKYEL
ncbi:DUF4878 domain-containing protein [archaeon]|nr:DUF4878 domain-containing protein [archaeon]